MANVRVVELVVRSQRTNSAALRKLCASCFAKTYLALSGQVDFEAAYADHGEMGVCAQCGAGKPEPTLESQEPEYVKRWAERGWHPESYPKGV